MSLDRIATGRMGEEEAVKTLKRSGYRIIEKNYRCRYGEIDIIASDGDTIVFVEVKTRGTDSFGSPKHSVTSRKQRHIIMASAEYLGRAGMEDRAVRFDVVSIELTGGSGSGISVELIKDAFGE